MKLREFLENINELVKKNPEYLNHLVVTSSDDEGNNYTPVYFSPGVGIFEDSDFIPEDQVDDWDRDKSDVNAVCVN